MTPRIVTSITLSSLLLMVGCNDDSVPIEGESSSSETGDGDGDPTGDGDGDPATGDGDGDPTTGDGDGDGDGDPTTGDGDGDGDPTTGDGDGDGDGMMCGNGVVEGDEMCDDGNDVDSDECPTNCQPATCGDGFVWEGMEMCDDAVNDGSYGSCSEDCTAFAPFCGDGVLDMDDGEVCDDGVNDGSYGSCAMDCSAASAFCGDGNLDMDDGEVCDDGINDGSYGGCAMDCMAMGPFCGDGLVDMDNETCDDENADIDDGCDDVCMVEAGNCCDGEPSVCATVDAPLMGSVDALALDIPDDMYDGTVDTMACQDIDVPLPAGICAPFVIEDVSVDIGIEHTWAGDLTIKLVSPEAVTAPLMSRVGMMEGADDGTGCCGDSSDLDGATPLTFIEGGATDTEAMGNTIGGGSNICVDDMLCEYNPNSGAAMGSAFEDYLGGQPDGTWMLCVGDSGSGDTGTLESVMLNVTVAPAP